jgi:hypothetical protein
MSDISNFGTLLELGTVAGETTTYASLGEIINVDSPEITNEKVESTNHSSTIKSFVYSNLIEISEFSFTMSYDKTNGAVLSDAVLDSTVLDLKLTFPNTVVYTFKALVTKFKPGGADATKPELMNAEVTLCPTDSFEIG